MTAKKNITAELYTTENGSTMSEVTYKPNTPIEWIADDLRDNYDGWDYAIVTGPDDEGMGTITNPKWDNGNIVAVLIEGGSDGYDELVAYDLSAHKYVDDNGNLVEDDYMPEYDAHRFVTVDYHEPLGFDVEDEAEWLEYAGNECGLVFKPGIVFDKVAPSYYRIAGTRDVIDWDTLEANGVAKFDGRMYYMLEIAHEADDGGWVARAVCRGDIPKDGELPVYAVVWADNDPDWGNADDATETGEGYRFASVDTKWDEVRRLCAWSRYPSTWGELLKRYQALPESIDAKLDAAETAAVIDALKTAYDDGKSAQ